MSEIETLSPVTTNGTPIAQSQPRFVDEQSDLNVSDTETPLLGEIWSVVPRSVTDGDTIRATNGAETIRVRFACIDAPESTQPLGQASRDTLRSILNRGKNKVRLQITDTDRFGRQVAQVWVGDDVLVQEVMAQKGMAYAYHQFKRNCPNFDEVVKAEETAKAKRIGVWEGSHMKPWDYRKMKNRDR